MNVLLDLIGTRVSYVVQEAIIVIIPPGGPSSNPSTASSMVYRMGREVTTISWSRLQSCWVVSVMLKGTVLVVICDFGLGGFTYLKTSRDRGEIGEQEDAFQ